MVCGATAETCDCGQADIGGGLEEDLDDADAGQRLAFDMLDIVHRGGQDALEGRDDAAGHFRWRQAAIIEDDADHRHVDVGKNVGRHVQGRQRPEDQDQEGEHDEGKGRSSATRTIQIMGSSTPDFQGVIVWSSIGLIGSRGTPGSSCIALYTAK